MRRASSSSSSPLRPANRDFHEKAVFLRLGERVRALKLNRILSREHGEGRRQFVRDSINADSALLHGLQQSGLRFCGSAVDLIRKQKRGKDRPRPKFEYAISKIENARPRNIGRHQVGRELNALEIASHDSSERSNQ